MTAPAAAVLLELMREGVCWPAAKSVGGISIVIVECEGTGRVRTEARPQKLPLSTPKPLLQWGQKFRKKA